MSPDKITSTHLAGAKILAALTRAPGNNADIGGLKIVSENGWFAARPSGTEAVYKLYGESLVSAEHLQTLLEEAQSIVSKALE